MIFDRFQNKLYKFYVSFYFMKRGGIQFDCGHWSISLDHFGDFFVF